LIELHITSLVITFHRRVTARKQKREKTEGKGRATRYGKAERNRGRERGRSRKKGNLYYAELRASCFCPHFLIFLIRQAAERKRIY